jgi:NAD-reducing hydrogenase large subunit
MAPDITIEPVTRIEGHAKITLKMGDDGKVADALFHVTQFRGFEKFIEGRPLTEMPAIMARICGICPVSHIMASAKACDDLLAVGIPPAADKLRRIMNAAQFVQSHALSLFHLSSPDLIFGMDGQPGERNIIGLIHKHPDRARDGVLLRKFGQQIIELLGGKRVHPAWCVPGGVNQPLSVDKRDQIRQKIAESKAIALRTLDWFKQILDQFPEETQTFGNFPSMYMSLVQDDGEWEHYDGRMRFIDADGRTVVKHVPHRQYRDYIGEHVEDFTYLKFPYYKPRGYPAGIYRVGPLARLNVCRHMGTELADAALEEFRQRCGNPAASGFHFHYARLVEIIASIERIERQLDSPEILDEFVRARARPNRKEGVGISEAPRGTIIHHYRIDDDGRMVWANLIIATGHNNLAMNKAVKQVAQHFVDGNNLREGMLNRVEAVVRTFDPCLSCSTHAVGQMPMVIEMRGPDGTLVDQIMRQ